MSIIIKIGFFFMNIIFSIMKLCPVQKKITYISRQMNTTPTDFQMIIDNFKTKDSSYKHVVLAKMLPDSLFGKIKYGFYMFIQMYHIATSQAVILDTYCIPISMLHQRDSLVVIQIWHALGAFKKFGYSILDQPEGSSSKTAHMMKMHHNYTYVLSSSEYASQYFAEAFHVSMDKMRIFPLPKTDLLVDEQLIKQTKEKIYEYYPRLKNTSKKIIVYAPTFRKQDDELYQAMIDLINHIDFNQYEFVLKKHPLTTFTIDDDRIIDDSFVTSLEFFHLADFIITDYSAVIFEAVLLKKPIYLYAFDYDSYINKRNFYIDYQTQMPSDIYYNVNDLMVAIDKGIYNEEKINKFIDLMIAPAKKSYTDDFVDFLMEKLMSNN